MMFRKSSFSFYRVVFALVFAFALFLFSPGNSQSFGPVASVNFPTGEFGDVSDDIGFTGGVMFTMPVGPVTVSLQGGYGLFNGKTFEADSVKSSVDVTVIPVSIGARYYVGGPFYAAVAVGPHFFKATTTVETANQGKYEQSENETKYAVIPGLGGTFPLSESISVDLSLNYTKATSLNYFAAQVAVLF